MFRWSAFSSLDSLPGGKCETRNGSLVLTTNNTEVEFQYYDTPHKKFKKMTKTYVSGMLQVRSSVVLRVVCSRSCVAGVVRSKGVKGENGGWARKGTPGTIKSKWCFSCCFYHEIR